MGKMQGKLKDVKCVKCSATYQRDSQLYCCPRCGGILEVRYNFEVVAERVTRKLLEPSNDLSLWKYFDLLPIEKRDSIVSLNEGRTELIEAKRITRDFGLRALYLKNETRNPTGSFKDRPNTVGISKALEFGADRVAIASSGNAAGSLAAYAARAGVDCIVAVPANVPSAKLMQIAIFGARIFKVRGTYSNSFNLIRDACAKHKWHNLTSVSTANPYQSEGDKTVAYELIEQMRQETPDWVAIPLGAGPLLVGVWKGFKEMRILGLINSLPRMIGVQAEGCAPIVRGFQEGKENVTAWDTPTTIAHSISDPLVGYEQDGSLTLKCIRESSGYAESVNDREMLEAVRLLARREAVFAEPSAAASVAVVKKLIHTGIIAADDSVVSLVTGTGLKSPETMKDLLEPPDIESDLSMLEKLV
jgi:threonine synthase